MRKWVVLLACLLSLAPVTPASADAAVAVRDNSFDPPSVTIAPGQKVTWMKAGNGFHTVTADDGSFDSNPSGCPPVCVSSFAHTFPNPGRYAYHCRVHGNSMTGVVVVTAPATPPATSTPRPTAAAVATPGASTPTPITLSASSPSPSQTLPSSTSGATPVVSGSPGIAAPFEGTTRSNTDSRGRTPALVLALAALAVAGAAATALHVARRGRP